MHDDDVDDHEDFASSHGAQLQEFALQLSGDASLATELVDGAFADVWADRHRLSSPEWPAFARERVARRWAARQAWPVMVAEPISPDERADDLRRQGHALATRRGVVAAAAVGSAALLGTVWQTVRLAGAGHRVRIDDVTVEVDTPLIDGQRVVQVKHDGDLMAEFRSTRDRPLLALTPLPDGRDLVVAWLRPEVMAVDVADAGPDPISRTTLVPLAEGTVALAVGRSLGRLPLLTYLTPAGYRTEPPSVPQAVVGWGRFGVTGYFVPRQGVFVLESPHREVLVGRNENQATVFLTDLGDGAQLVVVQSWSLVSANLQRNGRTVETLDQVFQNGALVCGVLEPPVSADHPLDITVVGVDGLVTIRVEG
ncbi:hypothetical protein ACSDQ9_00360 [Aestuariimicrobium soli]|uniref:hypothetical protein n=1 Tax=Aestuariimicrobium soli TaxID=2035834 RepID=UPI003EBBBAAE